LFLFTPDLREKGKKFHDIVGEKGGPEPKTEYAPYQDAEDPAKED